VILQTSFATNSVLLANCKKISKSPPFISARILQLPAGISRASTSVTALPSQFNFSASVEILIPAIGLQAKNPGGKLLQFDGVLYSEHSSLE
jgi:hypothetical protein